jgi:hypothetical protein
VKVHIRRSALLATTLVAFAAGLASAAAGRPARETALSVYPTGGYRLLAQLTAAQAVPRARGAAGASGIFSGVLRPGTPAVLTWQLVYMRLTGPARAAHVHIGAVGKAGPVAIPLCPPPACRSALKRTVTGSFGRGTALLRDILGGRAYVDVHTRRNPAGEIRGQIRVIVAAKG